MKNAGRYLALALVLSACNDDDRAYRVETRYQTPQAEVLSTTYYQGDRTRAELQMTVENENGQKLSQPRSIMLAKAQSPTAYKSEHGLSWEETPSKVDPAAQKNQQQQLEFLLALQEPAIKELQKKMQKLKASPAKDKIARQIKALRFFVLSMRTTLRLGSEDPFKEVVFKNSGRKATHKYGECEIYEGHEALSQAKTSEYCLLPIEKIGMSPKLFAQLVKENEESGTPSEMLKLAKSIGKNLYPVMSKTFGEGELLAESNLISAESVKLADKNLLQWPPATVTPAKVPTK